MAAREAARWAWCARAVFRSATASTAAARSGDGASSLRRIFDVTESAASGGRLRGCRPWVSVRTPSSDATTVRSFGRGYPRSAAALSLASVRPTIETRAFATAANDAPRSLETGDDENDRSSSAKHVSETSKRRASALNARTHRRAKETARRLRSKKRQSLTGIREWIVTNADRLDRFTAHLACRLLARHASRAARRARDERDGVFSLGGGKWRARVEPSEPSNEASFSNEASNEEEKDFAASSSRVIHGAIARIAGEVTNAHEWSRLLDGAAALARAGVKCGDDDATILVQETASSTVSSNKKNKKNANATKSRTRALTRSDAALWHVTSRGARFAASASPADVLTNLKALAAIAETRPGAVCPAGAAGVSRAAYARAVEWSDFELKSAEGTLDALVAFAKKEEVVYDVPLRDASRDAANDPPDTLSVTGTVADVPDVPNVPNVPIPNTHVESPNPKKKRRRRKKTNEDERSESAFGNEGNSRDKKVNVPVTTRHAFAEGFDAARALVRAVAAARADGTLMSVARARGGVAKKADDAGTSQFARRKKPKRTPKPKPSL